jgi:hypothetical protein
LGLVRRLGMSNEDDVMPIRNQPKLSPNRFSQSTLDAISHHGVSNLSTYRQGYPTWSIRSGCVHKQDTCQTDANTRALYPLNVPRQPQAAFTGKTQRAALAALAGDSRNQPLTALGAPTLNHGPAAGGLHASSEPVAPLTLDVARLVCALHLNLQGS